MGGRHILPSTSGRHPRLISYELQMQLLGGIITSIELQMQSLAVVALVDVICVVLMT